MIRLEEVSFTFPGSGRNMVLKDASLSISDGEWVALTGGNGSSKTTLCRLMAGLYKPTAGSVNIDGLDPGEVRLRPGGEVLVGIAFQNPDSHFVTTSVRRDLLFGIESMGLPGDEISSRLDEAAEMFGLKQFMERNPHTLSGGEKQRLLLASIWIMRPKHIVLDEPFSFLDAAARRSFLEAVRGSFHNEGRTVVWATLEPDEIEIAGRVICLEGGSVVFDGPPAGLADTVHGGILAKPVRRCGRAGAEGRTAGAPRPGGAGTILGMNEAIFNRGDFELKVPELSLMRGEVLGLLGPSGSGKTTMLLGGAGLLPPGSGTVSLFGEAVGSRRDFPAGRVAYLFQSPEEGFFAATVGEEVSLGYRSLHGGDGGEAASRALETVGLDPAEFIFRSPFSLSQGEKRLVAIASILTLDAELYLLDEPTLFLDGRARRMLGDALDGIISGGASLVIASHEQDFLEGCTDRIMVIEGGSVVPLPGPSRIGEK